MRGLQAEHGSRKLTAADCRRPPPAWFALGSFGAVWFVQAPF